MDLQKFFSSDPSESRSVDKQESSNSRLSRYDLWTGKFPSWSYKEKKLFRCRVRLHGRKTIQENKIIFKVFEGFHFEDGYLWNDIDFEEEQEAIDFMLRRLEFFNFRADENMWGDGKYFWSIKDDKPYKRYLGKLDGKWI